MQNKPAPLFPLHVWCSINTCLVLPKQYSDEYSDGTSVSDEIDINHDYVPP